MGGRPYDGQIAFNILAVRPPMVWGLTTRLAKFVEGPSMVRATPVTTVTQARSKVAAARMMVLRMRKARKQPRQRDLDADVRLIDIDEAGGSLAQSGSAE